MSEARALTRSGLAAALKHAVPLGNGEATQLVDNILKLLCRELSSGHDVKIMNFGAFHIREKGPRLGRNPKTGQEAAIAPRKVLTFKASKEFRTRVSH